MKISRFTASNTDKGQRLSAFCGDFEVWYQFPPEQPVELRADPFITAALIPAMSLGEDIEIAGDVPVCPVLLENLAKAQHIFLCWAPHFGISLKPIQISGGNLSNPVGSQRTASFFSGGVDGTYTFLKAKNNIDELLFVKGIDMQLDNEQLYTEAYAANSHFLAQQGASLVAVESNVRFLGHHHKIGWNSWNGAGLASIAMAGGYRQCYIASGLSYAELIPEGTSYITDHLFSNAHTTVIHHGADATRLEKLTFLSKHSGALEILRVCWQDKGYNCGACEKCIRTMAGLRALKLSSPNFPPLDAKLLTTLAQQRLYDPADVSFLKQIEQAAITANDNALHSAVQRCVRRFEIKQLSKDIDRLLLGGLARKLKSALTTA
ncbi:hypothetical protein [Motiliproteus sp. MSK22-1]|uniref:hypothetical protein n=1 Tax=Motiliproteus sp. MSK22-1 TaxID=1897630 RepID=UPI000978C58F|nr:hypothetical protein [Motiliproteus sp. MSK22-1]OMH25730.1 hypothetical protein BGP75_24665 [Motiliproteus sp. MSK22-1]